MSKLFTVTESFATAGTMLLAILPMLAMVSAGH